MCGTHRVAATLRDRWRSPPGSRKVVRAIDAGAGAGAGAGARRIMRATCRGLPGRDAERFGMGPAVVLGQDLAKAAGAVRHGAVADFAAGDWQLGNGHWEVA